MKCITAIWLVVLIALLTGSCSKSNIDSNATVMGRWNLVSDSTFEGVGFGNHAVNYTGRSGDYFDFRTDGNVYIKEKAVFSKLSYNITSDTTLVIASFGIAVNGIPATSYITTLTAHDATINSPVFATPGGNFGRTVHLRR